MNRRDFQILFQLVRELNNLLHSTTKKFEEYKDSGRVWRFTTKSFYIEVRKLKDAESD